ncbi:uncharacterized protein K452DRAFT_303892 [Aplosporella prunicola CBS 121167]|uniref:Uncharacterized protein n=1 Tax=Aplosporella prunicola CBS 121167 TaxID=1176127 RepID=A0A6A6AW63_9PEZI|nr:uncharacterized protein K452DRAFT_303892 [Aplosporella prunicola CBS 121167]KAF2135057.1 hypothetical protein K452DRAFT_303892 [Aplosporella prunicola CBS 121167]
MDPRKGKFAAGDGKNLKHARSHSDDSDADAPPMGSIGELVSQLESAAPADRRVLNLPPEGYI